MFAIETRNAPAFWCWRLVWVNRLAQRKYLIDLTVTRLFLGKPVYRRFRLGRWTVIERNREFGGFARG